MEKNENVNEQQQPNEQNPKQTRREVENGKRKRAGERENACVGKKCVCVAERCVREVRENANATKTKE